MVDPAQVRDAWATVELARRNVHFAEVELERAKRRFNELLGPTSNEPDALRTPAATQNEGRR